MIRRIFLSLMGIAISFLSCIGQTNRWQQHVNYTMDVHLDTRTHILRGTQSLVYSNHSPDTLHVLYYHLYYNAFQPGSLMDLRSRNITDPDSRIGDRISKLTPTEIGYQKITSIYQNKAPLTFDVLGTIMTVHLSKPILPGQQTTIDLTFEAQVPVQIRRTGRDNREGISYTMTQWYPKVAEYDYQGWHTYQYVAREFFGVWGDFDVTIHIDKDLTVAGTGVLVNAEDVGHGYEPRGTTIKKQKGDIAWHFKAERVHDFAWAADPDYQHDIVEVPGGPTVHLFYEKESKTEHWKQLAPIVTGYFQFMNRMFGVYPYSTYSVIQGGDGGMEYPMCTMILGEGTLAGTTGTMIHEVTHSWYQGVLGSNEMQHAWMDEGFTTYASQECRHALFGSPLSFESTYQGYKRTVDKKGEEPASLFSDYNKTNDAYKIGSYYKGALLLSQLRYIMGPEVFYKAMRAYYNKWKFQHPEPGDFISVMEYVSGMQLKWFMNYWIYTTKTIDYRIKTVNVGPESTQIVIERVGDIPMPMNVTVHFRNGTSRGFHIPVSETLKTKQPSDGETTLDVWWWADPQYAFTIDRADVAKVVLDEQNQTCDIDRGNNSFLLINE